MGQREIMKAMHQECLKQRYREFTNLYTKYGSEFEDILRLWAGNNGCVLHYIENNKMKVENNWF
jgi:Xaa-Pro aminopeptidase